MASSEKPSVLAMAKGHMPPHLATQFLTDDLIVFTHHELEDQDHRPGRRRNRHQHPCPRCKLYRPALLASSIIGSTAGIATSLSILLYLDQRTASVTPGPLNQPLPAPLTSHTWRITILSLLSLLLLVLIIYTRKRLISISTLYCIFTAQLLYTAELLIRRRLHGHSTKGPITRNMDSLRAGNILIRLTPWPNQHSRPWLSWLNWFVARWQDGRRCLLSVHLYETMQAGKEMPAPMECSVEGLEKVSVRREDRWFLVDVVGAEELHWPMRNEEGDICVW
ncbi:hypothetical protein QBC34DRAFT_404416 [Podospora aff. communis PSN243]|uniref:Uncharacterized protein n=1 Tax=Podospora aff. communis PSN243 TaxID=3040156 RepID=A0AAV9GSG5_9PEZI|nr:hypothetical protein QBC34DRAFT_404416 [Podospora aff. communis PSN243]